MEKKELTGELMEIYNLGVKKGRIEGREEGIKEFIEELHRVRDFAEKKVKK